MHHYGTDAVEIFFLISGFYMELIGKTYASKLEFYASRFIRIFALYWATLFAILLVCILGGFFGHWGYLRPYINYSSAQSGLTGMLFAAISNVTLFFQDTVMFVSHDAGKSLQFTLNFHNNTFPLRDYVMVPQGWSVSLELCFYLLVPFLTRLSTKTLLWIILIDIAMRTVFHYCLNLTNDPWSYRFAPFEIGVFMLGMLSYRLYERFKPQLMGVIYLTNTAFLPAESSYLQSVSGSKRAALR